MYFIIIIKKVYVQRSNEACHWTIVRLNRVEVRTSYMQFTIK